MLELKRTVQMKVPYYDPLSLGILHHHVSEVRLSFMQPVIHAVCLYDASGSLQAMEA